MQQLRANVAQPIDLETLRIIRGNMAQSRPNAVFIYPLILRDRLEIIVLSPDLSPIHKSVPVTQVELNQTIVHFLQDLQNRESDPKPNAKKLYDWLIRPIKPFLEESGADVILYAPDGQLRYIPLAALHDGEQWFIEKFQINQLTAASLMNWNPPPRQPPRIMAGAFSEGRHLVSRRNGEYRFPFSGLPFAKVEVEAIARLFPGTRQLIDQFFTKDATLPFINSYNIVHFATHAMFATGSPEDSFIVMGNGETVDLNEIRNLSLTNVDLMVLSGCQTAVNSANLGDGKEILGFGYQIQNAGARAAIASLWSVEDDGTEILMKGTLSKTAALQQAQVALIRGQIQPQPGSALTQQRNSDLVPSIERQHLMHPYYWAPFILIGNGL
jgi:CHAT domain-containing protein